MMAQKVSHNEFFESSFSFLLQIDNTIGTSIKKCNLLMKIKKFASLIILPFGLKRKTAFLVKECNV